MVGVTVSKAAAAGARTYLPSPSKKPAASELNVEHACLTSLARGLLAWRVVAVSCASGTNSRCVAVHYRSWPTRTGSRPGRHFPSCLVHCNERILSPRLIMLRNDRDYKFSAFR